MIKNVLTHIGGIGVYGVISICLFFTVFTGAVVWALCQKRTFLKTMGGLPLNDGEIAPTTKGNSHE